MQDENQSGNNSGNQSGQQGGQGSQQSNQGQTGQQSSDTRRGDSNTFTDNKGAGPNPKKTANAISTDSSNKQ